MIKIAIFTQNLSFGGVQRVVSHICNYIHNDCHLCLILGEDNKEIFFDIPANVEVYKIQTKQIDTKQPNVGEENFYYRVDALDKILNKIEPNTVLSFEDYNNLILLSTQYKCKKIISSRVNIFDFYAQKNVHLLPKEFYFANIAKLYPLANKIITVSNSISKELNSITKLDTITINNGIDKQKLDSIAQDDVEYSDFILHVGRLHKQKGQEDLIKAYNTIHHIINQKLVLIGDGEEKENLVSIIEKYSLQDKVILHGSDQNPYKYMKKCTLFVFPSYFEGSPNTLLEAMNFNIPIVCYDFLGLDEIFLYQKNVVQIGDIQTLADKILYFITNKPEANKLANQLYDIVCGMTLQHTLEKYKKYLIEI